MLTVSAGAITALKATGVVISGYVAWSAWRSMPESAIRRKMLQLFKNADLCFKRKGYKGKEIRKYPLIRRVGIYQDCVQIVFTLPDGLNPHDVNSRVWIFKQGFGEHIELSGNAKTFTLNIYTMDAQIFDYDFDDIAMAINKCKLPIYVGKDRKGDVFYDMVEHPHLLIAGETGSGKSVALRSILTTLLKSAGEDMELYCADLKRSEFHLFRDIAATVDIEAVHLLKTLLKLKKELKRRGDMLDKAGLANIIELPAADRPKFIVLAIDEVALLKKEKDIMEIIEEISAIGRALGVFLILSMQRPDADVLDGKLKNNLTVRMAFRHADEINSRITIGSGEAADIKQSQKGRMVFKLDGIRYVQAPYLDLPRAKALLEPFKRQEQQIPANDELTPRIDDTDVGDDDIELEVLPF